MKVITISNQKGGVGKTAVTANLAGVLASAGLRTLAIDLDSQAQLAHAVGALEALTYNDDGELTSLTSADILAAGRKKKPSLRDVILNTPYENLDIIPASEELENARRELENNPAMGLRALQNALAPAAFQEAGIDEYDWVVIDTSPKLDMLLDNALVAADYVLPVMAPETQQTEPIARFLGRVETVKESMAPDLEVLGILFNKANLSWAATGQIPEQLANMGLPTFETVIPMYAQIANSYGIGPVEFIHPNSRAAGVLRTFATELLTRVAEIEG